jgi:hypothetical protein
LAEIVRGKASEAIGWYVDAKQNKKIGATIIRTLTIASMSAAGILTVLAQIFDGVPETEPRVEPIWASLALAIAAALLGLDRYFGFSRAWIRYITTELKIRTALNQFNMSWPQRMADWANDTPDPTQVKEAISACSSFQESLDAIVKQETDQWVVDFQASLKDLDEATKAAAKAAKVAADAEEERRRAEAAVKKAGGLNLTITNGDQCEGGWRLSVQGRDPENCSGKTAAVANLAPGQALVQVSGVIGSKPKQASRVVIIEPGSVGECSVTLE